MGKTIIISSHILTELTDLCTSVGILQKGRLIYRGDIESVRRGGAGIERRFRLRLLGEAAAAAEILRAHPRVAGVEANGLSITFRYIGDPEEFHAVVKLLCEARIPLLEVRPELGDLESLFLDVTREDGGGAALTSS